MKQIKELDNKSILKFIVVFLVVTYLLYAYKDLKKGIIDGYNAYGTAAVIIKSAPIPHLDAIDEPIILNWYLQ